MKIRNILIVSVLILLTAKAFSAVEKPIGSVDNNHINCTAVADGQDYELSLNYKNKHLEYTLKNLQSGETYSQNSFADDSQLSENPGSIVIQSKNKMYKRLGYILQNSIFVFVQDAEILQLKSVLLQEQETFSNFGDPCNPPTRLCGSVPDPVFSEKQLIFSESNCVKK